MARLSTHKASNNVVANMLITNLYSLAHSTVTYSCTVNRLIALYNLFLTVNRLIALNRTVL